MILEAAKTFAGDSTPLSFDTENRNIILMSFHIFGNDSLQSLTQKLYDMLNKVIEFSTYLCDFLLNFTYMLNLYTSWAVTPTKHLFPALYPEQQHLMS